MTSKVIAPMGQPEPAQRETGGGFRSSWYFEKAWAEIQRLGLEGHVAELEAVGYTVVPPEKLAAPDLVERMREELCRTVERRTGISLNLDVERSPEWLEGEAWRPFTFMLFEDAVFQEAALNPMALAFADYSVGKSCTVSTCIGLVKGPKTIPLELHTDNAFLAIPAPYPPYTMFLNCTWALTDYTRDNGALCVVPGSHSYGRAPGLGEALNERVAIEAPAGSLIVWGGSLWHGSFERLSPGLRLSLTMAYTRPFVIPQERYREEVTLELLERNPPRFAKLMGRHLYQYSFKEEGYDPELTARTAGKTWWD